MPEEMAKEYLEASAKEAKAEKVDDAIQKEETRAAKRANAKGKAKASGATR